MPQLPAQNNNNNHSPPPSSSSSSSSAGSSAIMSPAVAPAAANGVVSIPLNFHPIADGHNATATSTTTSPHTTSSTSPNDSPLPAPPPSSSSSSSYAHKLLHNLNAQRSDRRFCDVELRTDDDGGSGIHAHRLVLSAASSYFEAMFRPATAATGHACHTESRAPAVQLHSIRSDTLRQLIDHVYTGRIRIEQCNVQELLAAADMLQLTDVVDECCAFLCRELHASNALGILRFAETHHCAQLAQSARTFVHTHFPLVAVEEELVDTPAALMERLLASERLRVDTEAQVFQAALRWIRHDVPARRQHVFSMLGHIRLALVPVQLIDAAAAECADPSMRVALRSVRRDLTARRGQLVPLRVSPRVCARKCIYIFGGAKRETSSGWNPHDCIFDTVAKYDIFRGKWLEAAPMQIGRIQPGVAALGGKIYVIGGERGSQILANGEVYDPQTDAWATVAPMVMPRCEFGLCPLGGTLWAVGGWIGVDIGGTMECYDPVRDRWTEAGRLPEPRFSMGVVSFEGLIYIVGGCNTSSRHLADVCAFNPVTGEWTELAAMRTARCQLGVAILGRWLYVVGGNDRNQDVLRSAERYSFDEDRWEEVTPMAECRSSPAVTAADGLLYVAGGDQACEVNFYRAQITISSVECYDPLKDEWKYCPELPDSRSEAGAIVL